MRVITFMVGTIASLFWGWVLHLGINHLDFVACVLLPETSIAGRLVHEVVLPSVMLTIALVSLLLTVLRNPARKFALHMSIVSLAFIPVFYALLSPISVTEPLAERCGH